MSILPQMNLKSPVDEQKASLRKQAATRRAQLATEYDPLTHPDTGLARFAASLIDQFAPTIVAGYWPVQSEINVLPLLSELQTRGSACVCRSQGLLARLIFSPLGIWYSPRHWRFGIKQPFPETEQLFPDVICVPLLAFDSKCQRLGYGGGYYDRTLAGLRSRAIR